MAPFCEQCRAELETAETKWYRAAMNIRQKRKSMSEQLRKAVDEVGGEPLAGSGFENETPDPEFRADNKDTDVAPAA